MQEHSLKDKTERKPIRVQKILLLSPIYLLVFIFVVVLYAYMISASFSTTVSYLLGQADTPKTTFTTYTYEIDEAISSDIANEINVDLADVRYEGINRYISSVTNPDLVIQTTVDNEIAESDFTASVKLHEELIIPVGHFYWITDSVSTEQLLERQYYTSKSSESSVKIVLAALIGSEALDEQLTVFDSEDELIAALEKSNEKEIAGLVTPENLSPELKLLSLDNEYYLDANGGGSIRVSMFVTSTKLPQVLLNTLPNHISLSNDNLSDDIQNEDIFSLRMTGVTALSRNLAIKIDRSKDYAYPAAQLGGFLAEADITHTSNEVSFVEGCVPEQSLRFCSSTKYFETLLASGIDVVELTGNHNNDFGYTSNTNSINMYIENDMEYFGGGLDKDDAAKILYLDIKDTKVALVGYNYFDTILNTGAIATDSHAGANSYSSAKLKSDIKEAQTKADIVIVDFQFQECYSYPETDVIYPLCYKPLTVPDQRAVFREAADFGADIVIGTQAHQPQTYETYGDSIIFYGLGNLYFDQISWIGTRQGIILTHYFIEGKYVQTKIDTTFFDGDMIPYLTYGEKRELLLNLLSDAR